MKPERFAERLFHLADEATLSQAALAEAAAVDRSLVCRLMKGTRAPTPNAVARLAAALDVTPHTLLSGTDAAHLLDEKGEIGGLSEEVSVGVRQLGQLRRELAELTAAHEAQRAELATARAERVAFDDLRVRLLRLKPELRAITSTLSRLRD